MTRVNNSAMNAQNPDRYPVSHTIVVGAGFGGLAAALLLRAKGQQVTLVDQHDWVGGKARTVPSVAGPIDAGPTVLTMRHVFDALFAASSTKLDDHVTLIPEPVLARHFWPDGSQLDLSSDRRASAAAIEQFAGAPSAKEFLRFAEEAEALFDLFDAPMMQNADPSLTDLARTALSAPRHLAALSPLATLQRKLASSFSDPRLRQLFGRYATYVGGMPQRSPALLSLIWRAEEAGVWRIAGGMHRLAEALAQRFCDMGGILRLGCPVRSIDVNAGKVVGVTLASGEALTADSVVFAGDPRALATGRLGARVSNVGQITTKTPRSLSARVWSFAAQADGVDLTHHNVFFAADPRSEFTDLQNGRTPRDPTLYVCAMDRGSALPKPSGPERFEIILNAPPISSDTADPKELDTCHLRTFPTLARFGLTFTPSPDAPSLATPRTFEQLFPGSAGALYGQSPHGMTAALRRPRARTEIRGLYLAGGGTHPGAGVPMAALSGQHAVAAMSEDLALT